MNMGIIAGLMALFLTGLVFRWMVQKQALTEGHSKNKAVLYGFIVGTLPGLIALFIYELWGLIVLFGLLLWFFPDLKTIFAKSYPAAGVVEIDDYLLGVEKEIKKK